jgi:PfaD family protein
MTIPRLPVERLGDPAFRAWHGLKYAYASGAMANGIASEALVIALGQAGFLSSFGAAGLLPDRIETAIYHIQQALPNGPYAFNLIHSPTEATLEQAAVDLYLQHGINTVEASAFLDLTPQIVNYRVAGLERTADNQIEIKNKVIAKVSRREVARKFLQPAPGKILAELVRQQLITQEQANLAQYVPMADDITVEADSGGHTDNRPLVSLLPSIIALRDETQAQYQFVAPVRVGAAGGVGTPASALAAFMMGAAYVVTGSINQSCLEAGASNHTKALLAQADMADVMMAPAADMFEMGVKLQVLKRGTFFPMRAQKLYDLYQAYNSIDEIPAVEKERLETRIFKRSLESIWVDTLAFFTERDPDQIRRAENNPKRKMALIFRWYLGLSSRWSNVGQIGREADYQIWCGPAMGAFNDWVRGSYLAKPENRRVVDVAWHLMRGAAFLYRVQSMRLNGLHVPAHYDRYCPLPIRPSNPKISLSS